MIHETTTDKPGESIALVDVTREKSLLSLLFLLIWAIQLRYPPLSYPHIGLLELPVIALIGILLPYRLYRMGQLHWTPVLLPALLFGLYAFSQWAWFKFSVRGAEEIGTLLWAGCYACIAYCLTAQDQTIDKRTPVGSLAFAQVFLVALSLAGLVCGAHAVYQYYVAYDEAHRLLTESIGSRVPDRTELGVLYHLKLKRVASIFGDPNTLATFAALSVCASLELLLGKRRLYKALAYLSVPASLAAVYYSGSRGGALDTILVFLIYGLILLFRFRRGAPRSVYLSLLVMLLGAVSLTNRAEAIDTSTALVPASSWQWRSNTVQERIYYLEVGARMIRMAPVFGLGPGSVEQYFGRLKAPEARETRYLHNWVVHIWAELGVIGLGLVIWFLATIFIAAYKARLDETGLLRAFIIIAAIVTIDGLLQISWAQREIMCTFGLVLGVLCGSAMRTCEPDARRPSVIMLTVFMIIPAAMAVSETLYLKAKSAKQIANDAMLEGNVPVAEKNWRIASAWWPNDPAPYSGRSSISALSGNLSSGILLLRKALALQPDSSSLNSQMADLQAQLGNRIEAERFLANAIHYYPTNPDYNYTMAVLKKDEGQSTQALDFAHRALKYSYLDEDIEKSRALLDNLTTSAIANGS